MSPGRAVERVTMKRVVSPASRGRPESGCGGHAGHRADPEVRGAPAGRRLRSGATGSRPARACSSSEPAGSRCAREADDAAVAVARTSRRSASRCARDAADAKASCTQAGAASSKAIASPARAGSRTSTTCSPSCRPGAPFSQRKSSRSTGGTRPHRRPNDAESAEAPRRPADRVHRCPQNRVVRVSSGWPVDGPALRGRTAPIEGGGCDGRPGREAHREGRAGSGDGQEVVDFLKEKAESSGGGRYGLKDKLPGVRQAVLTDAGRFLLPALDRRDRRSAPVEAKGGAARARPRSPHGRARPGAMLEKA